MFNFLSAEGGFFSDPSSILLIVLLGLFVVAMFLMPLFSRRKKNQVNDLYANLAVGDKIMTIGGIIGTVIEIKERSPNDKDLLIETGAEGSKTTLWIDLKGLYQNLTKPPVPTNFFGKPKNVVAPASETEDKTETDGEALKEPALEPFEDAPMEKEVKEEEPAAEATEANEPAEAVVTDEKAIEEEKPADEIESVEKRARVKNKK